MTELRKQLGFALPIAIVIVVVLIIAGGAGYYFYKTSQESEEVGEEIKISDVDTSKQILVDFFTHLHNKEYNDAVSLYAWEDAEDPGGVFYYYTVPGDKAKTLENFCKSQPTCLKVKVLRKEKLSDTQYKFTVQFLKDTGQIYVYGPCCGASEEEMPSRTEFEYKVEKIGNSYKVITPPLYRP